MFNEEIEPRLYQEVIFHTASQKNTLVVLPTGLGKTMIAAMVAAHRLKQYPASKVVFLAPTKPLVEQHYKSLQKLIDLSQDLFALFTGAVTPAKREKQFKDARLIFSTPQGFENDVMSNRISLKEISLMIFDESHRAVGDYSYVYLAKRYDETANHPRILGLTASPGTDKEKITEVCENLRIEEIEVRQESDNDVAPYVQEVDMQWIEVPFPVELKKVQQALKKCYESKLQAVQGFGYLNVLPSQVTKTTLLQTQGSLHGELARGNKEYELLKSMSLIAEAMKAQHAIELIETQGVYALQNYLEQLRKQATTSKSKATKNLVQDPLFKAAAYETEKLLDSQTEHPKLLSVKKLLLQQTYKDKNTKVILFTQYRDQAVKIKEALTSVNITSEVFVGQAKKRSTGLSQKEQQEMLDRFRAGEFSVLIATSVAEEGLDIPKVDLVLFYEPVPSAIRTVQRRGRTGRLEKGKVIILVTQGTRDVGYRWVAHHKEKRMYRAIKEVRKNLFLEKPEKKQSSLQEFEESSDVKVVADHREKGSPLLKSLLDFGVKLDLQQLNVGDFLVSDRCVIEYKRVPDFVDSIIDGRLLSQLRALKQYARPVILLEGGEDMYSQRKIHPNAIRGMIATITVSYGVPIISTKTAQESAGIIFSIARREQERQTEFQYHTGKPQTDDEQITYVVAGIPGIGTTLARPLLERFKTIKGLVNAPLDEIRMVQGIGPKKAKAIVDFVNREYGS